jgi:elongation factor Ts
MSNFTSKDVVALRQKTSLGMMDCKRALEATDGDPDRATEWLRKQGIAKGESRTGRTTGEGVVEAYIHPGAKIGVLLELACETDFVARSEDFIRLAHELAMQVAATNPIAVKREEVPQGKIDRELEIYREQIKNEGKPEAIADKIAKGKLDKYFQETCLLEQPFVKDPKVKVGDLVLEVAGKLKENVQVRRFARFALGD